MNTIDTSRLPARLPAVAEQPNTNADPNMVQLPLLLRLWRIAVRRKWIIIGSIIAITVLGVVYSMTRVPLYAATSQIEIARESARVVDIESVERETSQFDLEFYQTQYGLLASETLAEQVVRNLRLYDDPAFRAAFGLVDAEPLAPGLAPPSPAEQRQNRIRRSVAAVLAAVEVAPVRSSRLVDISVTTSNPALSARIANAWGSNFIEMNLKRRYEATSYARQFLESRLGQLRDRLEQSERQLVAYAAQQGIINLQETTDRDTGVTTAARSLQADQLASLNEELARAQADRIRAQSQPSGGASSSEALSNATIGQLRQRRAELQADYAKLMVQFEPDYPTARAIQQQIATLDRNIAREEGRVSSSIANAAGSAGQRERALQARVNELKGDLTDLRRRSIQYNIYQREVDTNRQLYDGLLQRYKEIGVAGGVGTNNISVVDRAKVPELPSSPNHMLNFLAALILGTIVGTGLAMLMEQIDEGITEPTDLPRILNVPLLGVVPTSDEGDPIAALANPRSVLVESYLAIQTNLELSTSHGAPRSISVTSTRPQEGKSTTSYALAHSLARAGRRVILVDGDMRSPSVHHEFDIKNEAGLSNFLAGAEDIAALLHPTPMPTLSFMTAGPQPPNAADLLVGDRLRTLVDRLLEQADHVIIDSPPVLGLADAPLIASVVEGTVYAVEARKIRTSRVRTAMNRLRSANINLLGAVLTKFSTKHTQYSYAYDYRYGYGRSTAQS